MKEFRLAIILLLAGVLVSGAVALPSARPVAAGEGMSSGCAELNDPWWDGKYTWSSWGGGPRELFAGEVVSVTAGPPEFGEPRDFGFSINGDLVASGPYPGTIMYVVPADRGDVTSLWVGLLKLIVPSDATFSVTCTPAPVPGCDVLMPIPATAVGGTFVADAPVYWAPGELTSPLLTIGAGNSARVIGQDASGQYYKIIWVCDLVWVPKAALGPNYDAVWNGRPLPTDVVD